MLLCGKARQLRLEGLLDLPGIGRRQSIFIDQAALRPDCRRVRRAQSFEFSDKVVAQIC